MKKNIVIITKDILMTDYLPVYGNRYWKTPNIDALAKKGTVFLRHYTAAPSTAMSFLAMCTGKYPNEFNRKKYQHENKYEGDTIFKKAYEMGYSTHLIWSDNYMEMALPYANCFDHVTIHHFDMNQPVGPHIKNLSDLVADEGKSSSVINKLYNLLNSLPNENAFIWIHLPHVLIGRTGYGTDIDLLDEIVGFCRKRYGDSSIYISADHGNMNCQKGFSGYGFHVYEPSIHIPLIGPKIEDKNCIEFPTSNTQLSEIVFENKVTKRDFVYSETTYALQPNRKTAVIHNEYKLIFDKLSRKEELYDVLYDSHEECDLSQKLIRDPDRNRLNVLTEVYFYPKYDKIESELTVLRNKLKEIWCKESRVREALNRAKYKTAKKIVPLLYFLRIKKRKKKVVRK